MANNSEFNEIELSSFNGFGAMLLFPIYAILCGLFILSGGFMSMAIGSLLGFIGFWGLGGFFIIQPNTTAVATFFGSYTGTLSTSGFYWANPFYSITKVSTKTINMDTPVLKVNDSKGNPIEIGGIIVWEVISPAKAIFGVEDYHNFVKLQAESAIREVASKYPYDSEEGESLRKNIVTIGDLLTKTIEEHVTQAGIIVKDARISHLAYSQEIAAVMLKKQQAEAIVEARGTLVKGAVSIVENALKELEKDKTVTLTEENKAELVINLMTVLVGDSPVQPTLSVSHRKH